VSIFLASSFFICVQVFFQKVHFYFLEKGFFVFGAGLYFWEISFLLVEFLFNFEIPFFLSLLSYF